MSMSPAQETKPLHTMRYGAKTYSISSDEIPGYEITSALGCGGMGTVWKATQKSLGRPVAIKILHDHLVSDEIFIKRFLREARAIASVAHPNIIQIYDINQLKERVFYAMEYVEGKDLAGLLYEDGAISVHKALEISYQVALALNEAHRKNIIHRDIKPQNIIITSQDNIKLTDFGLAKNIQQDHELTAKNTLLGSPKYMAPEQINSPQEVDPRTDIYALGITMYNMLSGEPPFEATMTMDLFKKIFYGQYKPLIELKSDLPQSVVGLVEKMMHRLPANRYQTCTQVITAIEEVVAEFSDSSSTTRKWRNQLSFDGNTKILPNKDTQRRVTQTLDLRTRRMVPRYPLLQSSIFLRHEDQEFLLADKGSELPVQFSTALKLEYSQKKFWELVIAEESGESEAQKTLARLVILAGSLSGVADVKLLLDIDKQGHYLCKLWQGVDNHKNISFLLQKCQTLCQVVRID